MYDLEQFYAEQLIIISRDNIEPISFHDKLTEILDRLGKYVVDRILRELVLNVILAATIKIVPEALRNGIQLSQIKKTREVAQPILGNDIICSMVQFEMLQESLTSTAYIVYDHIILRYVSQCRKICFLGSIS